MGHCLRGTALKILLALAWLPSSVQADDLPVRIVLFGDSYIASYGVDSARKFEVQLESALIANGQAVEVVGTGYTSTAFRGVDQVKSFLEAEDILGGNGPKVVILELGSNDCGRYKLDETQANLETILKALADQHIPVLVAGTMPYDMCENKDRPNYKALYIQMFADLAAKYGDLYYRDFKEGVGDHPELMQGDRDHPMADGDAVIVANILPSVVELVARAKQP
mgnify:CR=1 FL=1